MRASETPSTKMTEETQNAPAAESETSPQARNKPKQGHSAGTILTNRSKNITVITPFDKRRGEPASSLRKGTRWMHRTTLSLDERMWKRDYSTSAKEVSPVKGVKSSRPMWQLNTDNSTHETTRPMRQLDPCDNSTFKKIYPRDNSTLVTTRPPVTTRHGQLNPIYHCISPVKN